MKQQIAIDGLAASGKGTIARALAKELNFAYLDTGLLYRAIAHKLLLAEANGTESDLESDLESKLESDAVLAAQSFNLQELQDADHLKSLRHPRVSAKASEVAALQPVRAALRGFQRDFAAHPPAGTAGAILDGRDIATVILPDAPCKIFVTAPAEVRAQRRLADLQAEAKTPEAQAALPSEAEMLASLTTRDDRDQTRTDSPLRQDPEALRIDTGAQSVAESVAEALAYARECLNLSP